MYVREHLQDYESAGKSHDYPTRNRDALSTPFLRLNRTRNGYNYYGVKFFNRLPHSLKSLEPNILKRKLKRFLIQSAFYSFDEFLEAEYIDVA